MNPIPDKILNDLGDIIKEALTGGDQVALPSFGTFGTVKYDEHVDADPSTGEKTLYPPCIKVQFTPALKLVKQVKGRRNHE